MQSETISLKGMNNEYIPAYSAKWAKTNHTNHSFIHWNKNQSSPSVSTTRGIFRSILPNNNQFCVWGHRDGHRFPGPHWSRQLPEPGIYPPNQVLEERRSWEKQNMLNVLFRFLKIFQISLETDLVKHLQCKPFATSNLL